MRGVRMYLVRSERDLRPGMVLEARYCVVCRDAHRFTLGEYHVVPLPGHDGADPRPGWSIWPWTECWPDLESRRADLSGAIASKKLFIVETLGAAP